MSRKARATTLARRIRRLAEQYPTAQYRSSNEGCSYTRGFVLNGPPRDGCIVGQALHGYAVIPADKDKFGVGRLVGSVVEIDEPAVFNWIATVQSYQDEGDSWASAVVGADTRYPDAVAFTS